MERNETTRYWDALSTDYHMRVRFAPPTNGVWTCVVKIKINNLEVATSSVFNFNVIESGKHGYVTVHENKKNFALDGEVIFPVGQNLPHAAIKQYYPPGDTNIFSSEFRTEFHNDINGWKQYIKSIDDFGNLGGRFTRIFAAPHAGLVEWEEKGNYFRRMHQAYEMDNVINKLEEHDMFTIFDLLLHNYFMIYGDYDNWVWDWDRWNKCGDSLGCGPGVNFGDYFYPDAQHESWQLNYPVHPYNSNSGNYMTNPTGVKYPHDMFMLEDDLKFHEQRTRYYISRYGYSTQIYIWEQLEEPFHLSQDGRKYPKIEEPYFDENNPLRDDVHLALYTYISRMNLYVREHLQHKHQLLGLNAVAEYGTEDKILKHDLSIIDPRIDCVGINAYLKDPNSLLLTGHYDPDQNDVYNSSENSMLEKTSFFGNNFRSNVPNPSLNNLVRPVYFSECGKDWSAYDAFDDCQAGTDEFLDNMRFGFSGIAGFNKWHKYAANQYGVWENIVRAEQHMNGADVKNVIGTNYRQGRQQEKLDFYIINKNQGAILEMQYYLSEDKNSAVGYIYNRTVNYRTAGTTGLCSPQAFEEQDNNFNLLVNFDGATDGPSKKLKLDKLHKFKKYKFRFYDYPNGNYIQSADYEKNTGVNEKVKIEFPELRKDNAVVWFVSNNISKKNLSFIIPEVTDSMMTSDFVYPNPTTGKLYVPVVLGDFEVYNALGIKIIVPEVFIDRQNIIIDFTNFAKGIYFLYFLETSQTIKICVL